ncbi:MAG: hypothetical protein GXP55_14480 [Deltaproteobacteria bacterium]|nr:hypothetical protein [Deltaproteobacteria bacterium]
MTASPKSARWSRWLVSTAGVLIGLAIVPRIWFGAGADSLYAGDLEAQDALARDVAAYVEGEESAIDLGDPRFEGEWELVAYQMTILGLGQIVLQHPELRARYVPVMELAATRMLRPGQRAFATRAWHGDALHHLGSARGDAWLGWPNLALSMLVRVHPETPHARLNARITRALARRLGRAPHAVIETYPGQSFPTDVAACAASIALHDRATGADHERLLRRWAERYQAAAIDPRSGYLWQQLHARSGRHRDAPRGSGTAVAAYFLSFVDAPLSADLTDALSRHERSLAGFGAVREYADGFDGWGDVDSGPVLAGVSITATGFTLGAARANRRRALFERVLRTTRLFGVPTAHAGDRRFAVGGFFGNALLLAQLSALPAEFSRPEPE